MSRGPLGLPLGSVRALITLILLGGLIASMYIPITPGAQGVRTGLVALAVMAVQKYFTDRQEQLPPEGGRANVNGPG